MTFLTNLKLWIRPKRMTDPDFGELIFMHISKHPERSYWECEWKFPPTGQPVFIALRGGEEGPRSEVRRFYLDLPGGFDQILASCRPRLEQVTKEWLNEACLKTCLRPFGIRIGVEDPSSNPVHWDVSFETLGKKWLGITIPYVGRAAMEVQADT
jgi:hypothetical protein